MPLVIRFTGYNCKRAPAILRETSEGTSYQMVRLVFRPYTQVGRPICTSGPLRASTRVSSGFALPRHSSPSFGSYRARSCSTSPTERARRAGGAPRAGARGSHLGTACAGPHLHCAVPRACVRLLGPCFKTGRVGSRFAADPERRFVGRSPPWRRGAVRHGLRTVRPGRQPRRGRGAPALPRGEEQARRYNVRGPGKRRRRDDGELSSSPPKRVATFTPEPFLADPEPVAAHRSRRKCARRRPSPTGRRSPEGIRHAPEGPTGPAGLNLPAGRRVPYPCTSERFHALLNSLFKVLFNFEERVQEGVKPLRGKRMGSAPSARGIQPGGGGRALPRVVGAPLGTSPRRVGSSLPVRVGSPLGTAARSGSASAGRTSSGCGAPRPALGRLGRARGWRWLPASAESCTAPHRPDFAVFRGRGHCTSAPALPLGGGPGPPVPDAAVDRAGLSSVRARPSRAARAGIGPRNGARGLRRSGYPPDPS